MKKFKNLFISAMLFGMSHSAFCAEEGMSAFKKGLIAFYVVVGLAAVVVVIYCIKKRKENR